MARAGAKESLEQAPSEAEPKAPSRSRGAAGKAKAVAEVAAKAVNAAKGAAAKVDAKPATKAKAKTASAKAEPARAEPATKAKAKGEPAPKAKKAPVGASAKPPPAKGTKATKAAKAPKATAAAIEASAAASGFPAKTLEKLSRLLEEERETYLRQAHDLAAEAEALASEREPGDTQFDEESGEGDTLNVERERDLALSASARQAVEEIDRALLRMANGTYGVCERCGKKISVARLEALPYAALCIECKSREERRR